MASGEPTEGSDKPKLGPKNLQNLWIVSQFGWQVTVCILVGLAIDRYWNTSPWGTLACSIIGLVSSITLLLRTALASMKQSRGERSESSS